MQRTLVRSLLAAASLASCSLSDRARDNPVAHFSLASPVSFDAQIIQRVSAGPYVYLEVESQGVRQWVATLAATCTAANTVRINIVAKAEHFRSALLARDFAPLSFGSVVALNP